jgi:thiamine-monophosphate kinase
MRLRNLGEFGAIARIGEICSKPGREVIAGIGDDAAAYRPREGRIQAVAADMMVEGVHFDLRWTSWHALGRKSLAVNLSDIAAMGCRPQYCLVSIALRRDARAEDFENFYRGLESMAAPHGVRVIGGDTCATDGPAVVSVTIIGEGARIIRRSGARAGDDIYVTGSLGGSAGGLEVLRSGRMGGSGGEGFAEYCRALAGKHTDPEPRVLAGRLLGESGTVHSMIDISDGLSSDLDHILQESGVGAVVREDAIPMAGGLVALFGKRKARSFALDGGEDYELLFTAAPRDRAKVDAVMREAGLGFTLVGNITSGPGAYIETADGEKRELRPKGYAHFAR